MRIAAVVCAVALSLCSVVGLSASTEFTYQGQLRLNSIPATGSYDLQFSLFDAVSAGNLIAGPLSATSVTVTSGLFSVPLDFGVKAFPGTDRWIEVSVRPAGSGSYTTLTPRQKMTYAPYALALPNLRTEASNNGPTFLSANVIGGSTVNVAAPGVTGVVIAGGGATNGFPQTINAIYSVIGGGYSNTIGVGGAESTIAGGTFNNATASYVSIGGGTANTGSGLFAVIAGGNSNTASGIGAVVPGGQSNTAAGNSSFAAGNRAKALNNGAFVWGDSTNTDVTSTANDQFMVRANGGVVVNTTANMAFNTTNGLAVTTAGNVTLNATNGVILPVSAGGGLAVPLGTLYKDNTVVAWGRVLSNSLDSSFNVQSFVRNSTGNYTITLLTSFGAPDSLIPTVAVSYQAAPTSAATVRFAGVGPFGISNAAFNVYVNAGTGGVADADFTFIVTGR